MLNILLISLWNQLICVTNSTDREQKWQCHYPGLLPGGPGSPWLPVRPAGPAGPVGPFIPETSNSHSYPVKEHAVLQSLLQEWPKQAVTVSGGFAQNAG